MNNRFRKIIYQGTKRFGLPDNDNLKLSVRTPLRDYYEATKIARKSD